ncbi:MULTISPECIES: SAR1012 family small protein [Staphylococcus]|uniref:SAR1012 family small protein n=1 Tax=Staphylococcus hsinchuensis TaxID=3051183 RepID=A0ABZ3EBA2_9STAP|nr:MULTISPECIES: SAR1012 family small protein [unclassified Staphylococcus]
MKEIIQRVFRALLVGYIVKAIRNLISRATNK